LEKGKGLKAKHELNGFLLFCVESLSSSSVDNFVQSAKGVQFLARSKSLQE
jgi:hypothetical protein